ncbi:MAG: hypothetical protein GY743_18180 [Planctomycetaceae bacterium]|nr:hypothetical protein [Planctomycetaceae bacterium]
MRLSHIPSLAHRRNVTLVTRMMWVMSPVPTGLFKCRSGIENLYNAGLGAHALSFVDGFMARQWRVCLGNHLDFSQQVGLIFLNLNKQMALHLADRPESFFDSAWRPG